MSYNINNNNNKECKHEVLFTNDLTCTVCGMSRYDQLQNKEERLTKKEVKKASLIMLLFLLILNH